MRRIVAAIMPVCAVALVLGSRPALASSMSGVVIRADTQAPVVRALVEIYTEPNRDLAGITQTNDAGQFTISGLSGGRYRLILHSDPLFDTTVESISLGASEEFRFPIPLTMEAAYIDTIPRGVRYDPKHQGRLRGVVMEAYTGDDGRTTSRPLKGEQVGAFALGSNAPASLVTTDAAGAFAIGLLAPGQYMVIAEHAKNETPIDVAAGSDVLVASPLIVSVRNVRIDDSSLLRRQLCGGALVQPAQTADIYIVCGY